MITPIGYGGYAQGSNDSLGLGLPAGYVPNDILVALVESDDFVGSMSMSGWLIPPNAPVNQNADEGTRLNVFWRRADGFSDAAVAFSSSGNHKSGRVIGFRGVKLGGDPWEATNKTIGDTGSVSGFLIPGVTTLTDNCAIVIGICGADNATNFSSWSNPNLTGLVEQFDDSTGAGNDGAIACVTGFKTPAGNTGNTVGTILGTSNEEWAAWIGALIPEPEVVVSSEEPLPPDAEFVFLEGSLAPEGNLSLFVDNDEIDPSPALQIDTWQFDTPPDNPEDRDDIDYYLAWQMADQTGENIDKIVRAVRITAKANNPQVQIHAASPGDEIDKADLESGTGARATIHFEDSEKVTRYKREKVHIKNLSIWTARYSGRWNGENERDRLDELIMEGDSHGTKR